MKSPFVICGATGNVGSKVAEALLAAGKPVRAIGRIRPTRERNPANTTPTTLEEFAKTVFAMAYRAAA